jgi:anti-sigma factor RsiW
VDGELSPRRRKLARRHLDRCEVCARELTRLSELKTVLAEHGRHAPPMDATEEFFWSQVSARIRGETKPRLVLNESIRFNWKWVLGWTSVAMATAALAVFLWIQTWPQPSLVTEYVPSAARETKVARIITATPDLYAEAYHSRESRATILWTQGMPVISLEL